ncbi:MAG: adenylate/guanylate cyclase domain-containing protein [Hyphomicrobiales bacterium]|nr:adenylate/guanylate cyclase domain-containing protein [Hyphomicrobiales bacterium]
MGGRRLTAILAADIAGYSTLMSADEVGTLSSLRAHQAVVLPMVAGYDGRIVDTAGDGILAEFPSVLNAVRCAVAIQDVMRERNASADPGGRMQYRMGVNQGDVLCDADRLYGDGVNIAARLESICEPGGIYVSGKVYDEIRTRCGLHFEDLGEQALRNIPAPLRVHRIVAPGAATTGKPARPAPHRRIVFTRAAVIAALIGISGGWWSLSVDLPSGSAAYAGPTPALVTTSDRRLRPAATHPATAGLPDDLVAPSSAEHHPYDGTWELVLTGGERCPVKSRTFRLVAQGGALLGPSGQAIGTVGGDGAVRFSVPTPVNPRVMVDFRGRLAGEVGSGTYRATVGLCEGTYRAEVVERL